MSIEVVGWALRVPVGGNMKVCLLGLANHAHPDGTNTYPSLDTLATYAACDRSTARRNVRKLVEDGWIVEDGTGPKGTTQYRIRIDRTEANRWGGVLPPVAPAPDGGGTGAREGVAPMPPEPSKEPSKEPSSYGRDARGPVLGAQASLLGDEQPPVVAGEVVAWPAGFDVRLEPVAREVHGVLLSTAEARKGAKLPKLEAVGAAMVANPRRDFVRIAQQLQFWLTHGNGSRVSAKDIVQRYANWLSREDEVSDGRGATPAPVAGFRAGGSRSAAVDANMDVLDGLSDPHVRPWE